jgi:hypothetical protein
LGSTCSLNTNPIRIERQTGIMYCMYGQTGIWPHFYTLLLCHWTLSPHNYRGGSGPSEQFSQWTILDLRIKDV